MTHRYLFQGSESEIGSYRGPDGGWSSALNAHRVVGSDANYYNRGNWKIYQLRNGTYFIENFNGYFQYRYLFQTGESFTGISGDERGWTDSPKIVTVENNANYSHQCLFRLLEVSCLLDIECSAHSTCANYTDALGYCTCDSGFTGNVNCRGKA